MLSASLTKTFQYLNAPVGSTIPLEGSALNIFNETIQQNVTAQAYEFAFNGNAPTGTGSFPNLVPNAGLTGLFLFSTEEITVGFYNGSSLLGTALHVAGKDPYEWHVNSPTALFLGTSTSGQAVTQIKVTTPTTLPAPANLFIFALNFP